MVGGPAGTPNTKARADGRIQIEGKLEIRIEIAFGCLYYVEQ